MSNVTEDTDLVTQLTDKSDAAHTHPGGSGDMEKATYDPANKNAQLAALTDLAVDGNLSAAAQDAITKKHANTLDHSNALDHSNSLDHDGGAQDTTIATKETPTGSQAKVDSHAGAADPHTGYQKESEKGAASGYASLGAGGLVPISQLASGTPDGTKYVRDDGTLVTPPGGSQAFPVGSVFISVVVTNPATLLGYGTWSAIAAGRVLVGLDSGDTDFDTVEEIGGAKTVQSSAQTFAGTPSTVVVNHVHVQNLPTGQTGGQSSGTRDTSTTGSGADALSTANPTGGAASYTPAGTNAPGAATSVVQPYFVVYVWKRTA